MRRPAFTLIELLVVISILAVIISLLLPSLGQAREAARAAICKSRIRTMHLAIESYRLDNKEWYPVSSLTVDTYWQGDFTFMPQIDPYLDVVKVNGSVQSAQLGIKSNPSKNFIMCPSSTFIPNMALTEARKHVYDGPNGRYGNYWMNARFGMDGSSFSYPPTKTVPGRPSTTIMLGEVSDSTYARFGHVTGGIGDVKYYHANASTHYLLADGQIRQTSANTGTTLNLQGMYLVNGP